MKPDKRTPQGIDWDTKYPEKEYKKMAYLFSQEELAKVRTFDAIVNMGQLAQIMLNQVVQDEALKRVGVVGSPDLGVLYNIPAGQFFVYTPKVMCYSCKRRKATLEINKAFYCESCANIIKTAEKRNKKKA